MHGIKALFSYIYGGRSQLPLGKGCTMANFAQTSIHPFTHTHMENILIRPMEGNEREPAKLHQEIRFVQLLALLPSSNTFHHVASSHFNHHERIWILPQLITKEDQIEAVSRWFCLTVITLLVKVAWMKWNQVWVQRHASSSVPLIRVNQGLPIIAFLNAWKLVRCTTMVCLTPVIGFRWACNLLTGLFDKLPAWKVVVVGVGGENVLKHESVQCQLLWRSARRFLH